MGSSVTLIPTVSPSRVVSWTGMAAVTGPGTVLYTVERESNDNDGP